MTKRHEIETLKAKFDRATGKEQWQIALRHKSEITVYLDNDLTYMVFNSDNQSEPVDFTFKKYLGCTVGAVDLLTAIGIKAEEV